MLPKIIIGVILLIIAVMTFGFLTKDKFGDKPAPLGLDKFFPSRDYFADTANLPSCGDKQELFAKSPLQLSDFDEITPLGLLGPTGHTLPSPHLYFNVRKTIPGDDSSTPAQVDVIAPTDFKVTTVKWLEAKNKPEWNDGAIVFGVCREFKAYFDHMKTFSEKIKKAYDDNSFKGCNEYTLGYPFGSVDYRLCIAKVDVEIKAGEKVGTAGGGEGQRAFDFGAFDTRVPRRIFANFSRWEDREQMAHVVCALDYFPNDLKQQLKDRLGGNDIDGKSVKSQSCGEVIQDIPGTAMGVWARPGDGLIVTETTNLSLVHENVEPQYLVFSMADSGKKANLPPGKYTFLPKNEGMVNRHFKDITSDGKVYCFETIEKYYSGEETKVTILLDMPTEQTLRIGKLNDSGCDQGPWQINNFVEFVR